MVTSWYSVLPSAFALGILVGIVIGFLVCACMFKEAFIKMRDKLEEMK